MATNDNIIWKICKELVSSPTNITDLLQQGYRYAFSLTHNPAAADDLLQDAWLAILTLKAPQNKAYLFATLRNRYFNQYKREQLVPLVPLDESINDAQLIDHESDFSHLLATQDELNKALALLRPIEREIVFLYYIEAYTTQQIAEHTQLPKGTICSLIHRSREKLRNHLDEDVPKVAP